MHYALSVHHSGVHTVFLHIVVDQLAVLLLLLLNFSKRLTVLLLVKFKYAGVIKVRGVLFGGKQVGADKAVAFLILALTRLIGRAKGRRGTRILLRRSLTVLNLGDCLKMPLLYPGNIVQKSAKLRVFGAVGVLAVFFNAKLLLSLKILYKPGFLLCKLHFLLSSVLKSSHPAQQAPQGYYSRIPAGYSVRQKHTLFFTMTERMVFKF